MISILVLSTSVYFYMKVEKQSRTSLINLITKLCAIPIKFT
jgi:hypothetical protein